jgi:hypothetical protein
MVARGFVKNGVVVLEEGIRLPEGQEVRVIGSGPRPADAAGDSATGGHRVLDIPAVSLGPLLRPLQAGDDLLGEMLDERQ